MFYKALHSGKDTATITGMATGAAGFEVSFEIGMNSISFRAFVTNPVLLVAVFSAEVFFDANEVTKGMARVVVETCRLGANKDLFFYGIHRVWLLE